MKRPLAGPSYREALRLQLLVRLQHGVRVDRQFPDHVADLRELVAEREVTEPQRMLDLVHELQVRRHARSGVEAELDRRARRGASALLSCSNAIRQ